MLPARRPEPPFSPLAEPVLPQPEPQPPEVQQARPPSQSFAAKLSEPPDPPAGSPESEPAVPPERSLAQRSADHPQPPEHSAARVQAAELVVKTVFGQPVKAAAEPAVKAPGQAAADSFVWASADPQASDSAPQPGSLSPAAKHTGEKSVRGREFFHDGGSWQEEIVLWRNSIRLSPRRR